MFAIALFDRRSHRLLLARDRFGKKPLYYARHGGRLLFASELKALRAVNSCAEIDRTAVAAYFRRGYVPSPLTIYAGVAKLPPGCFVVADATGRFDVQRYWDACAVAVEGRSTRRESLTDREATAEADGLLRDAVRRRMVADVPLGAFLSGGIDSSTVVALMQAEANRPIRTFALGFSDADYDEAPAARAVASHLGTDHTELYVTAADAQEVIPRLADIYDEPLADYSQIPTVLVAALARKHVTVALSGDGGDEVFGGYVRHIWAARVRTATRGWPTSVRRAAAQALGRISPTTVARVYGMFERRLPSGVRQAHPAEKLAKLARILAAGSDDEAYRLLVSVWPEPVVLSDDERLEGGAEDRTAGLDDFAERMMLRDQLEYLPDNILAKVDRATMTASLEARAPLLDHRLAEWAWRLPLRFRCRHGRGKWLLRQVLAQYVPTKAFDRPKTGFGIPVGSWMRRALRDWCEALLDHRRLVNEGYLDAPLVRDVWREHLSGTRDHYARLWAVLMFEAWLDRWR
jgi:asparagine synthase (glutamine-hydrolysing)